MTWRFARGDERMSCEAREAMLWYELIVTMPDGATRVERYTERAGMLRRQHELLCAWKAQGWLELEPEQAAIRLPPTRQRSA
jgi:hypothetical protein